jgi:hypothetical protein
MFQDIKKEDFLGGKLEMLRQLSIALIILRSSLLSGQGDSVLFNSEYRFKDGVYAQYTEVLRNAPKYSRFDIEVKPDVFFGRLKFYHVSGSSKKELVADSVFAYVDQGILRVKYKGQFHKLILKGPISTFYIETTNTYSSGYTTTNTKLYFIDLLTGNIDLLTPDNIDPVIERDRKLYMEFSNLSRSKKRKTLYSYVIKYNQSNPVYIKPVN